MMENEEYLDEFDDVEEDEDADDEMAISEDQMAVVGSAAVDTAESQRLQSMPR
jgi:hypothetical protein